MVITANNSQDLLSEYARSMSGFYVDRVKGEPRRPVSRVLYPAAPRRKAAGPRAVTIYLAHPRPRGPLDTRAKRDDVTIGVEQPTQGRAGHP
jgi:hypothetical protein